MRGPVRWLFWLALTGLALAGCGGGDSGRLALSAEKSAGVSPPVSERAYFSDSPLGYFRKIRFLPNKEREEELHRVQQAFLEGGRREDRVKLALLLILPGAPFQDLDRALGLLKGAEDDPKNKSTEWSDFSLFLYSIADEIKAWEHRYRGLDQQYQRLDRQLDEALKWSGELEGKLEEAQKRSGERETQLEEALKRSRDLEQKSQEAQKRSKELEQKLDDLKAIEKTLMEEEERSGRQER